MLANITLKIVAMREKEHYLLMMAVSIKVYFSKMKYFMVNFLTQMGMSIKVLLTNI